MDRTWTILKFTDEDSVEAVPTTWIFGNRCYWPPLTQQKMLIAIKNHESPNTCWPSYEISFFKNGTFDNYLEARQKCRRAECQSDLVSDEDLKNRKIRNKQVIYSSSGSEDGLLPDPPIKNKLTPRNIEKKKDVEQPGPSGSFSSSSCDDIILKKLAADFDTFCVHNQRKNNILTSMMTDLLSEVKSLKNIINERSVLMTSDSPNNRTESIFEKLNLPARTLEEFKEIENYLLQTQEDFGKVVQEVSKIGGKSPFDFVKRVMLQFMTYETATSFTWYGRKEKLCFKDTKMSQIILRSSEAIGDQKQIEEALQKFFRRAKERSTSEKMNAKPATSVIP